MTEREAIDKLARLVAALAYRCWEALGTDESKRIQQECAEIVAGVSQGDNS